ncbi:glycosyltransferase [Filimonas effusa]|uniref:Glycosyltransferase n=1 Tax=Filimonas effusa TaxID=2508721 RepID=A0A4Q1CZQ9_9BACT|nr:glycosyltransferase [Filimonas effusa]RXK80883.1 glycosyltransferase [Filimonas effusa]
MNKILEYLGIIKRSDARKPFQVQLTLPGKQDITTTEATQPISAQKSKKVSISYAITVHNEGAVYLEPLFQQLLRHVGPEDEIVVLDDFSDEPSTVATLEKYKGNFKFQQKALNGNFGEHKNFLNALCTKKYIFQIDADELLEAPFFLNIKQVMLANPQVELFHVPRINTLDDITDEDIRLGRWGVDKKGWINSPDYQARIYKNIPEIKWEGRLHETITGQAAYAFLPYDDETYSIIHKKTKERWRKQDEFYKTLI